MSRWFFRILLLLALAILVLMLFRARRPAQHLVLDPGAAVGGR